MKVSKSTMCPPLIKKSIMQHVIIKRMDEGKRDLAEISKEW